MSRGWICLVVFMLGCASASKSSTTQEAVKNGDGCDTPLGFIPEGRSAIGYLHQIESRGQTCQQGTIECRDGTWTGAYIYPSCVPTP